jgi:hypothetical protein
MDNRIVSLLFVANLVVGVVFLVLTGLFTFGRLNEGSALATGYDWNGGMCLLQSTVSSFITRSGTPSCWDLMRESTAGQAQLVSTALLWLTQSCGVAAAALLLNAFTVRRITKK